ncbi:MAG: hypothetical protein MSC31_08060 [Solirubrobacteraceae bacterium MAG38_C4-C5]|nr:hypothetical protein [Candidatus Siliceabacter maunaloa]
MAESALAVPRQGFGERTAFLLFGFFLRENGRPWPDDDDLGDAEMVERAASGETTHDELVAWVRSRLA